MLFKLQSYTGITIDAFACAYNVCVLSYMQEGRHNFFDIIKAPVFLKSFDFNCVFFFSPNVLKKDFANQATITRIEN